MNGIRTVCAFVVGLGFGAAVVWFVAPEKGGVRTAPESVERARPKRLIAEGKDFERAIAAGEEKRLLKRIAEIEGELRTAKSALNTAETNASARASRPLSYDEWFALQREANPERYRALTNSVVRSISRWALEYRSRAELLDTVDASAFGAEEAAVHGAYRDALARISDLRREELARRCASPDFKADNSSEWQSQLREANRQVNELEARERFMLLGEAGRRHGLKADDARELAETMHLIIETTSSSKVFMTPQWEGLRPEPTGTSGTEGMTGTGGYDGRQRLIITRHHPELP